MTAEHGAAKASTVRAIVRGTRTALLIQLLVAIIALGAVVFAFVTLQNIRALRDKAVAERSEAEGAAEAAKLRLDEAEGARQRLESAMPYLRNGYQAWARNDLQNAITDFNAALGEAPNDPSTLSALAQVRYAAGDIAGATETMQAAIDAAGSQSVSSDHIRLASYYCADRQRDRARDVMKAAPEGTWSTLNAERDLRLLFATTCASVRNAVSEGWEAWGAPSGAAGEAAEAAAYNVKLVYLHIRTEADRADAERIAAALRAANYSVPGIELVEAPRGYGPGVRYYYAQQAEQAHAVAEQVVTAVQAIDRWRAWTPRELSLAGRYDRLPTDRVEVWLPEPAQ